MSQANVKKPIVTDIFVEGAKKGWVIATTSTVPNVLMAFVIIKALQITGALDAMGAIFSPVMAIFGLPGEAAAVLIGAWMSMGGVPVITMDCGELNDRKVGELFYFLELCCGVSAYILDVNPFNQPGVELYKRNMFQLLGKPGYEK